MNIQNGMGTTMQVPTHDDWGDDKVDGPPEPGYLTPRQEALRDGIALPATDHGMARAKRMDKMQSDVFALSEFVNDLDRIIQHMKGCDTLVGNEAGPYVDRYLKGLRAEVSAKGRQLYADLTYLRSHP